MDQHQAHGVHAIAEIVRYDRNGNRNPDDFRNLKRQADRDTVHKAVADQGESRQNTYLRMAMRRVIALVPMMDQDEFFQPVKQEKSGHQRDHRARGIEPLHLRQSENLRQDVEAHDAEENAGGEGENKMHSAAELERKEAPGNSCAEGGKREQECGHRSMVERGCARTNAQAMKPSRWWGGKRTRP